MAKYGSWDFLGVTRMHTDLGGLDGKIWFVGFFRSNTDCVHSILKTNFIVLD